MYKNPETHKMKVTTELKITLTLNSEELNRLNNLKEVILPPATVEELRNADKVIIKRA